MNISLSSLPTGALIALGVLAVAQVVLDVFALVDLYRRPADRLLTGNKWVWVAVILLVNLLGAVLYLAVARKPAAVVEPTSAARAPSARADTVAEALYGSRPGTGPR